MSLAFKVRGSQFSSQRAKACANQSSARSHRARKAEKRCNHRGHNRKHDEHSPRSPLKKSSRSGHKFIVPRLRPTGRGPRTRAHTTSISELGAPRVQPPAIMPLQKLAVPGRIRETVTSSHVSIPFQKEGKQSGPPLADLQGSFPRHSHDCRAHFL